MRVRIEYFDQNETFAAQLPREGSIVVAPRASDSSLDWYLVALTSPVVWEGAEHTSMLIASRWKGDSVVGAEPTSVFILLVPPGHIVTEGFSYKQFTHVAWGMCHVIAPDKTMEPTR
jgi:hypothetical protein